MGEIGMIRNRELISQIKSFEGIRIGSITPTDIDFLIEYHNLGFIIAELKHKNKNLPRGQEWALTRLIDSLNKPSILIVAEHDVPIPRDIIFANSMVRSYYIKNKWNSFKCPMVFSEAVNVCKTLLEKGELK